MGLASDSAGGRLLYQDNLFTEAVQKRTSDLMEIGSPRD